MMAMRPADGRNPDKTKLQAQSSKEKVALAKVNQLAEWRKMVDMRARRIEKAQKDIDKLAESIRAMEKKGENSKKALEEIGSMIKEALTELKEFQEVPSGGHLPHAPTHIVGLASILPVIMAMAVYWKAVKTKLK